MRMACMKKEVLLILLLLLPLAAAQSGQDLYRSSATILLDIPAENLLEALPANDVLQQTFFNGTIMVVKNRHNNPKVDRKIAFPIGDNSSYAYTLQSDFADSENEAVKSMALALSSGQDDEFIVVYNFAQWVRENIRCSRSGEMSQNASALLETKQGTCEEAISLFIALSRAAGIPSRFVSGVAFMDSQKFEERTWAEVYFPGIGWVPYDIALGQFGYVDLTHIAFHRGAERQRVFASRTPIDGRFMEKGLPIPQEIDMRAFPLYDNVNFSSYNIIEVSVRNLRGHYIADEITIAPSPGLDMKATRIPFALGPFGERREHFTVKIVEAKSKFISSFPISVYSSKNVSAETRFRALSNSPTYISGYFPEVKAAKRQAADAELALDCFSGKAAYYINETAEIRCVARNTGGEFIQRLAACIDSCESIDLGVGKEREIVMKKHLAAQGSQKVTLTAKNSQISRKYQIYIDVLDFPKIAIVNFSHPGSMEYDGRDFLKMVLEKKSVSSPLNASATLMINGKARDVLLFNATSRSIMFELKGDSLEDGPNVLSVQLDYFDGNGRKYYERRAGIITLKNLNFFQKVRIFFRKIAKRE